MAEKINHTLCVRCQRGSGAVLWAFAKGNSYPPSFRDMLSNSVAWLVPHPAASRISQATPLQSAFTKWFFPFGEGRKKAEKQTQEAHWKDHPRAAGGGQAAGEQEGLGAG